MQQEMPTFDVKDGIFYIAILKFLSEGFPLG